MRTKYCPECASTDIYFECGACYATWEHHDQEQPLDPPEPEPAEEDEDTAYRRESQQRLDDMSDKEFAAIASPSLKQLWRDEK